MTDVLKLTQDLIQFKSVTPENAGCLEFIANILEPLGFECTFLPFEDVTNLYARLGKKGKNICFAGHIDVVPAGDERAWTFDPFKGTVHDEKLYGRGTADMKGSVAAFICAVQNFLEENPNFDQSISFLLTSDEEGPAIHGTQKVVEWLQARNETIDACLVGEPTSSKTFGDMIKVGRRASLRGHIKVHGTQGHVAYPELADNPIPKLLNVLNTLLELELDQGYTHFNPSNLEVVSVDVGNTTGNIIPNKASAFFNVRYNPSYTKTSLIQKLKETILNIEPNAELVFEGTGDPFYTHDKTLIHALSEAIEEHTHQKPEQSTSGGTSDARFMKDICPVVEFGLLNSTIHKVNEHILINDLYKLVKIYQNFLKKIF